VYCIECGKEVERQRRFCVYCGAPVEWPAEDSGTGQLLLPEAAADTKGRSGTLLFASLTIGVCSVLIFVSTFFHWTEHETGWMLMSRNPFYSKDVVATGLWTMILAIALAVYAIKIYQDGRFGGTFAFAVGALGVALSAFIYFWWGTARTGLGIGLLFIGSLTAAIAGHFMIRYSRKNQTV